jgi:hypothetical protein
VNWCSSKYSLDSVNTPLTLAPLLVWPDFSQPFEVVCDAAKTPLALGAVLLQSGRPIAYFSCKLPGAELNYSPSDIEMQAVISALKGWHCYLERCRDSFTLVTYHQPNVYLDTANKAHTVYRRARCLSVSCGYHYKWCYPPGRINIADPIPRASQHFQHPCYMVSLAHSVGSLAAGCVPVQLPLTPLGCPCIRALWLVLVASCVLWLVICHAVPLWIFRTRCRMQEPACFVVPLFWGGVTTQTTQVTKANEHVSLDPIGKVVASYSDVDMSQQQEISCFLRENFFQRIKHGYSSDSASEAAVHAQRQRCI